MAFLAGDLLPAENLTRMGCTLRRNAAQTLNDAVDTTVSWDTETEDTHSLWAIGTPTVITIPQTGLWAITFQVQRAAAVNAKSFVDVVTTATAPWSSHANLLRSTWQSGEDRCCGSFVIPMSATATFTLRVNADGAANSTMTAALTCFRAVGAF